MSDPFLPQSSQQQVIREAKLGFGIAFLIVSCVGTWSYFQYTKFRHQIPQHIQTAPVAQHVGPEYYLRNLEKKTENPQPAQPQLADGETQPQAKQSNAVQEIVHAKIKPQPANIPVEQTVARTTDLPVVLISENPTAGSKTHDISTDFLKPVKTDSIVKQQQSVTQNSSHSDEPQVVSHRMVPNSYGPSELSPTDDKPLRQQSLPKRITNEFASTPARVAASTPTETTQPFEETEANLDRQVKPTTFAQSDANEFSTAQSEMFSPADAAVTEKQSSVENLTLEVIDRPQSTAQNRPVETDDLFVVSDSARYQTHQSDSFWSIAQIRYEDGRYFRALYEHNRAIIDDFENIPVGSMINTPPVEILHSQYPTLCPQDSDGQNPPDEFSSRENVAGHYRTRQGDTLFEIARQTTGQASRYLEIIQLNKQNLSSNVTHLTRLPADLILQLPE